MSDEGRAARSAAWGVVTAAFGGGAIAVWATANSPGSRFPIWPVAPFGLIAIAALYMCFASLSSWWPAGRSLLRGVQPKSARGIEKTSDSDISARLDITDRFTRAVRQLTSNSLEVRLAAIYVLAQIANGSPSDHQNIVDILCTYAREHSQNVTSYPTDDAGDARTPRDLQTIVQVIGRRHIAFDQYPPDLRGVKLPGIELYDVDLSHCYMPNADLSRCSFHRVSLEGAQLGWVNFEEAHLVDVSMSKASLGRSCFVNAYLHTVDLRDADLSSYANLTGSTLFNVRLQGICMEDADWSNALFQDMDLTGIDFGVTNLSGANLEETEGLSKDCLRGALTDSGTRLPEELC